MLEYLMQEDLIDKSCYVFRESIRTYTCSKKHRHNVLYKILKGGTLIKTQKVFVDTFFFNSRCYVLPNKTILITNYTTPKHTQKKQVYKQKEKRTQKF